MRIPMRPWSEKEIAQLMRAYRQSIKHRNHISWIEIAAAMPGRSIAQCQSKVRYHLSARQRCETETGDRRPDFIPRVKIPAAVLAEANARHSLRHQSLTAAFCGDPLPGRSALDRRKSQYVISLSPILASLRA